MSDLISRQWFMECIDEGWIRFDTEKDANTYIHLVRDIAPSAQPKRGRWLDANICGELPVIVCDQCNTFFPIAFGGFHNFCLNCGADMRGEKDIE